MPPDPAAAVPAVSSDSVALRLGETAVTEPLKHLPTLTQKPALERVRCDI